MKESYVLTYVTGIALDEESHMPMVILKEMEGDRSYSLWIGPSEAGSIIIQMEGAFSPRPLTHDLLAGFFRKHHFTPLYFLLYGMFEDDYLGRVDYKKGFRRYSMEVRPSDGISLAVRLGMPIYVTYEIAHVLHKKSVDFNNLPENDFNILHFNPQNSTTPIGW